MKMAPHSSESAPEGSKPEEDAKPKTQGQRELEEQIELARKANHKTGLTKAEAVELTAKWGPNELPEKKRNPILVFLSYFWGPMPIMIWIAIIIELIKSILVGEGWEDFAVLLVLQFANAIVGFMEEHNAGNAIAALKSALKPKTYVCREGSWAVADASTLVPGDLIRLKLGDVIPADAIYVEKNPLEVDQAALTGESLPVTIHQWGHLKMGSAIKRGEGDAIVVATGSNTFLGTAAKLMNSVTSQGHLQAVLLKITAALLILSVILCAVIFAKLMTTEEDSRHIQEGGGHGKAMASLSVVIVILVASIPIAIEVVCTSTLAVGSHQMAAKKVIVARLSAIEELAGMTILCSDKTGTLTLNQLSLREPILLEPGYTAEDIVFWASLCSKRDKGNQDAIDFCCCEAVPDERKAKWADYTELHFEPFNPTDKRTRADLTDKSTGAFIQVAKGAPQVLLKISHNKDAIEKKVKDSVLELADRGFRSLGVAINRSGSAENPKWEYLGILSLFDPPRHDTKATIAAAVENSIEVKMVTGDHTAIAKETCRELGMGTNILNTSALEGNMEEPGMQAVIDNVIMEAHGFAEVMPEHKFLIVERIRQQGHVTGMTGDGVNDAPALKRADVGIAVHGATDAARAAADLVLTEPGLSVIIDAISESRKIFQRMRNYIIYRIACTIQLLCFFFFAALCVLPDSDYMYGKETDADFMGDMAHAAAFTLPVISMVIITILNDGCMITISHDRVVPEKRPQRWAMMEMTIIAIVLGFVACISSLIMLAYGMHANAQNPGLTMGTVFGSEGRDYITWYELRTMIYLKVSVSDFLTLFSARTRTWFWDRPVGRALGIAAFIATACSTLFSLFWDDMFQDLPGAYMAGLRHSKSCAVATWIYCILWFFVQDACKVLTYYILDKYFTDASTEAIINHAKRHAAAGNLTDGKSLEPGHGHLGVKGAGMEHLPPGVDLNAIISQAHEESLRSRKAREAKEAEQRQAATARLKDIASGAASREAAVEVHISASNPMHAKA